MKVLQIIQKKQYRGADFFSSQLPNELELHGHEVKIYSIYNGTAELLFQNPIDSLGRKKKFRYLDLRGWQSITRIVEEYKPDIVQANTSDALKYTVFSKELFKWMAPIVFRNASVSSCYIKKSLSKWLNYFLLKKVDWIISVSNSSKQDLNSLFPFTKNKSTVITNGIDINQETKLINPYN